MKILFLTDNFPPEVNAPATRTYEHARIWVGEGHEVTVITCAPNFPQGKVYDGYKNKWRQEEMMDGIRVVRVWSYIAANRGIFKRIIDFVSYSFTSFLAALRIKADVIVATSPQFFTALSGRAASFWKRTPWVMEVRDLWPASVRTVGAAKHTPGIGLVQWQANRCYKSARRIVVVTDSFKDELIHAGVPAEKIAVVKNGVDRNRFKPHERDLDLERELHLEGKRVVGYIGTHGMAHRLDFVLQCADKLREHTDLHFLFLGAGARRDELLRMKDELKLDNVTMLPPVSKDQVGRYISLCDVALINLKRSPLFETVIPSKIFENAAMEVPILMGVLGEAQRIVEGYGAGLCYEPENEADFVRQLKRLLTDEALYASCKEGCRKLAIDFDRRKLALSMLPTLEEAAKPKKR